MSLFKSKCSKSKLPNMKKIAEHSKVFCFKFNDICRQERHAVTVSRRLKSDPFPKQSQDQSFFQAEHFRPKSCVTLKVGSWEYYINP